MDFIKFWLGNFFHGGEAGETLVYKADFCFVLLGFVVKGVVWSWRNKLLNKHNSLDSMEGMGIMMDIPTENNKWDRLERWWHHWENKFVTTTSGLALVTFLFTAIAIAPYHRFEHSETEALSVSNELRNTKISYSNDLWAAKGAKEMKNEGRLAQLEEKSAQIPLLMADMHRAMIDMASTNPALAAATRAATNIIDPPQLTNTEYTSRSLQAEQAAIDAYRINREAQQKAQKLLEERSNPQPPHPVYGDFGASIEWLVKTFTNNLAALASEKGDRIECTYHGMSEVTPTNREFSIGLMGNSSWSFKVLAPTPNPNVSTFRIESDKRALAVRFNRARSELSFMVPDDDGQIAWRVAPIADQHIKLPDIRPFFRLQEKEFPLTNAIIQK